MWNVGVLVSGHSLARMAGRVTGRMAMSMTSAVGDSLVLIEREHKLRQIKRASKSGRRADSHTWTTRDGTLRASFHRDWSPGDTQGAYGSDLKRAAKIEEGGTIKSSRAGGSLAIPTKYAPKNKAWPRDIPDLFFKTSRSGKPYLAQMQGGRLRPVFLLRKSVTLPPRPALDRAVKETEGARKRLFLRAVDHSIGVK